MRSLNLKIVGLVILALVIASAILLAWWFSQPSPPVLPEKTRRPELKKELKKVTQKSVAGGLVVPWALDFLPDGRLLFTERPGNIRLIKRGARPILLQRITKVAAVGEGGLLGLAVHPLFKTKRFLYLYYTYQAGDRLFNRVVRYKFANNFLVEDKVIVDKIPGNVNHNGGRIKFGPDGLLYITTGDALKPGLAQNRHSLAGKILRVKDDGSIPKTNPFPGSPVYSFGHRNPQGLAWDNKGRLWATEHGSEAHDEVNLIEAGKNYGWPLIQGGESRPGLQRPVIQSGTKTWAPAGAAFLRGSLFFAGLRGQALFSLKIAQPKQPKRFFYRRFGRLRDVVVGPDGFLYISTSNRDGRGYPRLGDDRIIKLNPSQLKVD